MKTWGKSMGKRIIIGSMLVLTLLLLMPSIPAIEHKAIEDKACNDLVEQLGNVDFNNKNEIKWLLNEIWGEHPIIGLLTIIVLFRFYRSMILSEFSTHYEDFNFIIDHPIIFLRSLWLYSTAIGIALLVGIIIRIMGWD